MLDTFIRRFVYAGDMEIRGLQLQQGVYSVYLKINDGSHN